MASPLFSGRLKKSSIVQVKDVLALSPLVVLHQLSLLTSGVSGATLSPMMMDLDGLLSCRRDLKLQVLVRWFNVQYLQHKYSYEG